MTATWSSQRRQTGHSAGKCRSIIAARLALGLTFANLADVLGITEDEARAFEAGEIIPTETTLLAWLGAIEAQHGVSRLWLSGISRRPWTSPEAAADHSRPVVLFCEAAAPSNAKPGGWPADVLEIRPGVRQRGAAAACAQRNARNLRAAFFARVSRIEEARAAIARDAASRPEPKPEELAEANDRLADALAAVHQRRLAMLDPADLAKVALFNPNQPRHSPPQSA